MKQGSKILVAIGYALLALISVSVRAGDSPVSAPASQPAAEVMSAAGRIPHPAPKPGEVLETTIKALGNFEYDLHNGGNLPADVQRLNGVRIRLRGFMFPLEFRRLEPGEDLTEFYLVPNLDFCPNWKLAPPIHQTIIVQCPRNKAAKYYLGLVVAEGTLTVAEEKNGNYVSSLFTLSVTSVRPAQKIEEQK